MEHDGVSANTVHHHHANIHSSLKYALLNDLIAVNPAERVTLPKKKKFESNFYKTDDIAQLLPCVQGTWLETPVYLTCFYGFRRSEVLGLTWDAVDFANNTISVTRKVYGSHDDSGKPISVVTHELKTKSSRRMLPLVKPVREHLLNLREKQEQSKMFFGSAYHNEHDGYLCVTEIGDLIKPSYVTKAFADILKKYDLKKIRFHDLRHSCASLLISNGTPLKMVQSWLGHADFATTANIYAHISYDDKIEAGQVMANLLSGTTTRVRK